MDMEMICFRTESDANVRALKLKEEGVYSHFYIVKNVDRLLSSAHYPGEPFPRSNVPFDISEPWFVLIASRSKANKV